jgi:dipeptidase
MRKTGSVLISLWAICLLVFAGATPAISTCDDDDPGFNEEIAGCTAGSFGRGATTDGSVITFQSADCGSCDTALWLVPAGKYKKGDKRYLQNIPQVSGGGPIEEKIITSPWYLEQEEDSYKYFVGVFGHMNEYQLGISESTRGAHSAFNNSYGIMCVTELSRLAMERCKTAREAIQLMGHVAELYGFHGYSTGEALEVSDTKEAWHFEIYRPGPLWHPDPVTGIDPTGRLGCAWVAQRVPEDEVCIDPNLPRIGVIDLDDHENFMYSANILTLGAERGRYTPGTPADMRAIYGSNMNASVRLWNIYRILAPSLYGNMPYSSDIRDYPFSFKPDTKLGVADVNRIFRNNAEGTDYDNTAGIAAGPWGNPQHYGATRLAPTPASEYIDITQSRGWLPDPIGGIFWWANHTLNTSVPKPYYVGVNRIPEGENFSSRIEFNPKSYFWAFDFVNGWAMINWMGMYPSIRQTYEALEAQMYEDLATVDQEALKIYSGQRPIPKGKGNNWTTLNEYLTRFCIDNAEYVVDAWWDLANYLMVNFDSASFPSRNADNVRIRPQANWLEVID